MSAWGRRPGLAADLAGPSRGPSGPGVWRLLADRAAGAPAGALSSTHIEACDALRDRVARQGPVSAARRASP